jgi:hypothetical protein
MRVFTPRCLSDATTKQIDATFGCECMQQHINKALFLWVFENSIDKNI